MMQPQNYGPPGGGFPGPRPNTRPLGPPGQMPMGPPGQMPMGPPGGAQQPRPMGPPGQMPMGPPGGGQPRPMGPPGQMRPMGPPAPNGQLSNQMAGMNMGPSKPVMGPGGPPGQFRPVGPPGPRPGGPPVNNGLNGHAPAAGPGRISPNNPPNGAVNGFQQPPGGGPPSSMGRVTPVSGGFAPPTSSLPSMPAQPLPPHSSMGAPQQQPPPRPGGGPPGQPQGPPMMGGGQQQPGGPMMGGQRPPMGMGPPQPGAQPPMSMGGSMPPMPVQQPPMSMGGPMPPMPGQQPPMSMGGPMPGQPSMSMGGPIPGKPQMSMGGPMPGQPPMSMGGPMPGGPMPPMTSMGGPMPGQPPMSMGGPMPGGHMPPMTSMGGPMPGQPPMMGGAPGQMGPPGMGGQPPMMGGGAQPPQPGYPGQQGPPGAYPGAAGPMGAPQRKSLDPDSMPNPIQVMDDDARNFTSGEFFSDARGKVPPLVTTKFITRDAGNSGPSFVRSTMYTVPDTPDMKKQTGVPLGLVISPLADTKEGEYPPPVVNLGELGPVRCNRCKAYMSPFMQFVDGGKRFMCKFCKATTEVPQEYFQHLDHTGQRIDKNERPELCLGTYEFVATKDYCRDSVPPKPPGILFAIDVSYPMMKEGVVQLICQNMKSILRDLPVDSAAGFTKSNMKVGFMTYDKNINFYNCNPLLAQPQQMTVGDVHDMFVPMAEGLMVDVAESEVVIDSLMEQLPGLFSETRETETILGPVVQAGKEAFKAAGCCGKLVIFHHNLPVAEAPGKLKNRDDRKCLGTDREKTVLAPQTKFYNDLGQECVSVGCSVDLFLFNNAYIDIATLSQVSRLTGGQVYKYTYFQSDLDGERFIEDLRHNISRPAVYDGIMRIRTSTGVRPTDFFGAFFMANTTDMELAGVNSDMALTCEIKHDDKITDEEGVYIQAALLYTSVSGQRRLRIINLGLNVSDNMGELYRNCDLDTIVNFLAKHNISKLMESNPKAVRETLMQQCAQILACYRKNCASPSSAGQLILPECMKLLPLYTNCLLKSDAIAGGSDLGCDDRAFAMSTVSSMDVTSSVVYFYPRLIPLHDVLPDETVVPKQIRCTSEKIRDDGVYLLENGIHMLLYVGLAANPSWIQDVFGCQTAAQIDIDRTRLSERDNPTSRRVCGIISSVSASRARTMKLTIVRQRDKLEIIFKHFLCEDRSSASETSFSYVDFLCHMHKEIRALLS